MATCVSIVIHMAKSKPSPLRFVKVVGIRSSQIVPWRNLRDSALPAPEWQIICAGRPAGAAALTTEAPREEPM